MWLLLAVTRAAPSPSRRSRSSLPPCSP